MFRRLARRAVAARLAVVVVGTSAALTACGDPAAPAAERDTATGSITVFAASSLTEAFTALADAFGDAHPGASVTSSFAASSELATQVLQGAPADVFASADTTNMDRLVEAGEIAGEPQVFATNRLQIVVEAGNPLGITALADLADPALVVVAAAPQVPIGRYTAEVLAAAGVTVGFRSLEENVRGVLNKVALGEADAGIVYATDVQAAGGRVAAVDIPADVNVVARYPIAVTEAAPNPTVARAFVDFVASDEGRAILAAAGFGPP